MAHTHLSLTTRLAWVEQLSEGACTLSTLRTALPELDGATWSDLLEERHASALCPYPPCANEAGRPYVAAGGAASGSRVKLRGGSLVQGKMGKAGAGAFCSVACQDRAEWARGMVGTERTELLEDVERRRAELAKATREMARAAGGGGDQPNATTTTGASARQLPLPPLPTTSAGATADLLETLTIVEKPTPESAPSAPSPGQTHADFERPLAATPLNSAPRRAPRPSRPSAGAAEGLLGLDTSAISRTVLRASDEYSALPGAGVRTRQPEGLNGLPPPRWTSDPVMLDQKGREVDWVFVDEDGETDEVRDLMELALSARRAALEEEALERGIVRSQRE